MNKLFKKIIKLSFYLPNGNQRMVRYLRNWVKMSIGNDLRIYDAPSIVIDESRPWLLKIGDHVRITHGVVILTHDFSKSVLNTLYSENLGEGAETIIGNNCFIGSNSIILMGAQIGNNVIVGAVSVVHGLVPDNVVIAGNPARIICTIDEYLDKRRIRSPIEAVKVAVCYYDRYGKMPTEYEMRAFSTLFHGQYIVDDVKTWNSYESFLSEVYDHIK